MFRKILKTQLVSLIGVVFMLVLASGAWAQSDIMIDLSKETREEVSIAVTSFEPKTPETDAAVGREAREILENDLRLFELFLPVAQQKYSNLEKAELSNPHVDYEKWSSIGVQWLVKTQYETSGPQGRIKFVFRLYDVVNERFLLGKRYQGTHNFVRKVVHRFADAVMEELTGKRGVAETRIAFLSRTEHGKDVYAIDFDGYGTTQITDEKSVVLSPDWSPDGRSIVFTSYRDHNPDLIMVDSTGKRRRALLKLPGLNSAPAWSPDGSKISLVLSRDNNSEIYILNRWRKLTRLTRHFNIDTSPTWDPEGKRIAFTSDRSGTGRPQIYIMNAENGDRKGVTRITYGSSYNDNPAWSPDGDKIAYTSMEGRRFQIKIYFPKTRKTVNFTSGRGSKEEPTWSPDGRFLAYRVTRGKSSSIHIQRVRGKKSRKLTTKVDGGFSPTWSPYPKK